MDEHLLSLKMATLVHAGTKRKSSDIGDQERLAKRFEVLNLGVYYDARAGTTLPVAYRAVIDANGHKHYLPVATGDQQAASTAPAPSAENGFMEVEDSKDKVYIHDLDKELADVESDDEHPIFIPDIDKHLNKFPRRLLEGRDPHSAIQDKQLVLYNVPSSISLPKEEDNVRKVLIESRNRARLEQRAKIKKEQRGEMDLEEPDEEDKPKRVFARLKWKEPPADGQYKMPMPMHMEDADEATPEQTGPISPNFTVEEMGSDEDAMDLG